MHRKEIGAYEKRVSWLKSDKAAEDFLDQDLSNLDFSQFKPVRFEFEKKTARKIPYQRFIREALEEAVSGKK
jgi:predicted DNA binding CopG/RHH family protein